MNMDHVILEQGDGLGQAMKSKWRLPDDEADVIGVPWIECGAPRE